MGDDETGLIGISFEGGIARTPSGVTLSLSAEERALLRELQAELASLLAEDSRDPSLGRLFPPAYEDDEEAQEEYRGLMHGELLDAHREALAVMEETAGREHLSEVEAHSWLTALNGLRLVLGTRLGVTEDLYDELDPQAPNAAAMGVYLYLTWLQEQLVEALAGL